MDIVPGLVQNVGIDPFAHRLAVQRMVAVGDHIAAVALRQRRRHLQPRPEGKVPPLHLPHLQKQQGKGPGGVALQTDGRVLPVAEGMGGVDVFVRQIDAAGIGDAAVDDGDLPVIPVIIVGGKKGLDGGKHPALEPKILQVVAVIPGDLEKFAGAVVKKPHIHALVHLAGQNIQDLAPHGPFLNDKVFQKDGALCLLQILQEGGEKGFAGGVIGGACAAVDREAAGRGEIMDQAGLLRMLPAEGLLRAGGREDALGKLRDLRQPVAQGPVADVQLGIGIKGGGRQRRHQQKDQPGDGVGRLGVTVHQIDGHHRRQQREDAVIMGGVAGEAHGKRHQQAGLQQHQQQDHAHPAEHQMQKTPFAPAQQGRGGFGRHKTPFRRLREAPPG